VTRRASGVPEHVIGRTYDGAMSNGLRRLKASLLPAARRWRDRLDAPQIRQARYLAKRVRSGPLDVLYLADSTAYFVSPHDSDKRQLRHMLADEIQPELSFLAIGGGGYHARMFTSYLRLFEGVAQRPIVIVPLTVRTHDPTWLYHPFHGHPRAVAKLDRLTARTGAWRMRMTSRDTRAEDMAEHDKRPHPSLAGEDLTIADQRMKLKRPKEAGLDPDAYMQLLYAYHHTHLLQPEDEGLANMTKTSTTLREMGFSVIPYETPIPVQKGVELLGSAFRDRVERNMSLVNKAFLRGYPEADIIHSAFIFETGEFLDPADASEHLNEFGRRKLVDAIVTRVRAEAAPTRA
jgi:hypothetical protein